MVIAKQMYSLHQGGRDARVPRKVHMKQSIYQVDAFANRRFTGNPAGICILPGPGDDVWMHNVAMEMNLAETAFLYRESGGYNLRWFTPQTEVDLCGHATLAAAHALWENELEPPDATIAFYTRSGKLTARLSDRWIELDFPGDLPAPCEAPDRLLDALGVDPQLVRYIGKARFDYLVELTAADSIHSLEPETTALKKIPVRGIIVTAQSDSAECDFVSRFFAPAVGVPEDPVTGSAHCCLAPYWQSRIGKNYMVGFQASERGGYVRMQVIGDRVLLGGQAVTTMRGELV